MATTKGQVTLRGRFRAGSLVRLVRVAGEHVLRPEGGDEIAEATVDAAGCVQFTKGVEAGARYFVVGQLDGTPLEVRCRGNVPEEENSVLAQAPVQPERQKLSGGKFADEVVPHGAPRSAPKPAALREMSSALAAVDAAAPTAEQIRALKAAAKKASAPAKKRAPAKKAAPKKASGKSTTAKPASRSAKKGK